MTLPFGRALANGAGPSALVMGTGRPGGDYALYGTEWGKLAQTTTGVEIALRASGGAAANILLIEQGAAQLGLTTLVVAEEARNGTGNWTAGVKFQEFRALFPAFPSILQIISPRTSGITTLAGLAGQVVGIGPDGGTGAAVMPAIFSSVGVLPAQTLSGGYLDQVHDMLAGKIAACAFIGAPPLPAIVQVAMGQKLSLIGFSEAEAAQVARTSPGMTPMVLQAGMFPGQTTAVASVGTVNFAIGAASLPDALAGALTLAALRNQPALAALVHAAGAPPDVGPIIQAAIPFHPGAAKILRDHGLRIPDQDVQP
jgi:TRAP transporter TAXI family solute receptor